MQNIVHCASWIVSQTMTRNTNLWPIPPCVQTFVNHHRHRQTCAPNRKFNSHFGKLPGIGYYIGSIVGLWSFEIVLNSSGARIAWMANIYRNSIWNTNEGVKYQQCDEFIAQTNWSHQLVRCDAKRNIQKTMIEKMFVFLCQHSSYSNWRKILNRKIIIISY